MSHLMVLQSHTQARCHKDVANAVQICGVRTGVSGWNKAGHSEALAV